MHEQLTLPESSAPKSAVATWEEALVDIKKFKHSTEDSISKAKTSLETYSESLWKCWDRYKEKEGTDTVVPAIELLDEARRIYATSIS